MSKPNMDRFQPPTNWEQAKADKEQQESEWVPCKKCRETVNENALDEDGLCPNCHNEEEICNEEYIHEEGNCDD